MHFYDNLRALGILNTNFQKPKSRTLVTAFHGNSALTWTGVFESCNILSCPLSPFDLVLRKTASIIQIQGIYNLSLTNKD